MLASQALEDDQIGGLVDVVALHGQNVDSCERDHAPPPRSCAAIVEPHRPLVASCSAFGASAEAAFAALGGFNLLLLLASALLETTAEAAANGGGCCISFGLAALMAVASCCAVSSVLRFLPSSFLCDRFVPKSTCAAHSASNESWKPSSASGTKSDGCTTLQKKKGGTAQVVKRG